MKKGKPMSGTSKSAWKPTGGKDTLLEARLNTGIWNSSPIYIHVTSQNGFTGITTKGQIDATPKSARRGAAAKNGVYLNPSLQTFGKAAAYLLLFFESSLYQNSADYCFVFAFLKQPGSSCFNQGPISDGSWVKEIIYYDNIKFNQIDILYSGPNPFVPLNEQNHPNEDFRISI